MPSANVRWAPVLTRLNPWYPGQMGVPGTDNETGLRLHTTGTVFYVDPNAVGVSDQRDGTDPTEPLQTVAAALTHCQAHRGDVIAVMDNNSWYYGAQRAADGYLTRVQETVTVNVPGVRIVGVAPAGAVGVPWQVSTSGGTAITVTACDVTIEGFAFIGHGTVGGTAIASIWVTNTYYGDNLTVRHCLFDEHLDTGISLNFTYFCDIHHNVFQECDVYGIYEAAATSGVRWSEIHHNSFTGIGTTAIALLGQPANNNIYENHLYNANAQGGIAATDCFITTAAGSWNLVHHNTLSCQNTAVGAGDYGDTCSASLTDAWCQNYCMNGPTTVQP